MIDRSLQFLIISLLIIVIAQIALLNRERDVYWMIPKHAECAVKKMYFRQSDDTLKPEVRTTCHWVNK